MAQLPVLSMILSLPADEARDWSMQAAVNLIGVEFICPIFRDGQNIVSCKINKTAVEAAGCEYVQEHVTLEKTTPFRRNPLPIGSIESFNKSNCKPVQGPVTDGCWCNESNRDIFDYKCALTANRSQDVNAVLKCNICISPRISSTLVEEIHENCKPMYFGTESQDSGGSLNVAHIVGVNVTEVTIAACLVILLLIF